MEIASGMGLVAEEERRTDWGGWYYMYSMHDVEFATSVVLRGKVAIVPTSLLLLPRRLQFSWN